MSWPSVVAATCKINVINGHGRFLFQGREVCLLADGGMRKWKWRRKIGVKNADEYNSRGRRGPRGKDKPCILFLNCFIRKVWSIFSTVTTLLLVHQGNDLICVWVWGEKQNICLHNSRCKRLIQCVSVVPQISIVYWRANSHSIVLHCYPPRCVALQYIM